MNRNFSFVNQDDAIQNMIASSLYRCGKSALDANITTLPAVSDADVERSKQHVTGHIRLMRKSTPEYYSRLTGVLEENDSCLFYLYKNFDVFGRYGNQKLKDELKAINLRLGATLSESNVGTNAAVMASRSPSGAWVIGDDHYLEILKPYACYAFQIHGRYGRSGYIMLITHAKNLTPSLCALFKFIEGTESIITTGQATEDVIIKDVMIRNKYSRQQTDNIVIIIDSDGFITYANDVFYDVFELTPQDTISSPLEKTVPELGYVTEGPKKGRTITPRSVEFSNAQHGSENYSVDCAQIANKGEVIGTTITLYKAKPRSDGDTNGYSAKYSFDDILGVAENFVQLKRFAERIAGTPSSVLIQGESGTGKELFAHAIHCASHRQNKPFVAINCAAIPRELIGSELFGYVGGSFTGANKTGAMGKFEIANGGTLFLDEIGEMPLEMQSVLLRVLEENAVFRIGASKPIPIDVRLITATNRDLQTYIDEGKFRADLYYRLNVVSLNMIPLRHHREDIPVIADAFVKKYARSNNVHICGISPAAMQALIKYKWPGNIRELRNTIERGVIMSENGYIELENLLPCISGAWQGEAQERPPLYSDRE